MKKRAIWRSILILVLCCSLVLNVFAATVTNEDGSITTTTENSNTVYEEDKTVVTETVTEVTNGTTENEDGTETTWVEGEETVTVTETMKPVTQEEEVYAGSIEVTFGEDGTGSGQASITAPTAPEGAENVVTGEGSLSWDTSSDTGVVPSEGDGTDVDGDGIVDAITTQTTTDTSTNVTWTDREVDATLTEDATETTIGEKAEGEIIGVDGAVLPEGGTWTKVEDSDPAPAVPEVSVTDVSLTVNNKVDGAEDIYDAGVKFDVFVTEGAYSHNLIVIVKQNGVEVGRAYVNDAFQNVTVNADGTYTVDIQNMNLQEGVDVDVEITLDGVQELGQAHYTYTSTTMQPVEMEDQELQNPTSHEGNDKGNKGGETSQGHNLIADTESWSTGSHDKWYGSVHIKAAGIRNGNELVEVTVSETMEADFIVVKAANGYIKYMIPDGVLYAGVTYTVENVYNSVINKNGGISHVCVYGTGNPAETPMEEVTETIYGVADESRTVGLQKYLTMVFDVVEAVMTKTVEEESVTVTTRTWEDSETTPVIPDPNPEEETEETKGDPEETKKTPETPKPEVTPNNPQPITPPQNNTVVTTGGDLEEIAEEEVPLADVPNTGDASILFTVLAILSACGLAVLAVTRKREQN